MSNPLDPVEEPSLGWRPWLLMGLRWCWLIVVLFAVICLVSAKDVGQETTADEKQTSRRVSSY